jgi:hypothetical protein
MRPTTTAAIAALALFLGLGVGLGVRPMLSMARSQAAVVWDHKCLANGRICVGMKADQALQFYLTEGTIGGLIGVECNFTQPGAGASDDANLATLIESGCGSRKYVASFSDGQRLINLWVDNGAIVRIDNYPRHVIDF